MGLAAAQPRGFLSRTDDEIDPSHGWRPFILLRLTLIIATSYLILAQSSFAQFPPIVGWLIAIGLLSNIALSRVPARWALSPAFTGGIVVVDTLWITAALISSGNFGAEFFYLYFFVLFLSAVGENLGLIVLGAIVVSSAYLYGIVASGNSASLWNASTLVRIPFLFAVASFYGYLVDRLRKERQRAHAEALSVARLRATQVILERANRELEREISVRRQAEEQLRKLSRAVEQSPSIVIITDMAGTVEYVNPKFTDLTGYSAEETVGRSLLGLEYMQEDGQQVGLREAFARAVEWHGELHQRKHDGETFWASASVSPLKNGDGVSTHFIAVQEDITDQKQAEQTLRLANQELTKLSQLKSDFVATVSHELRTPLTSIKNSLELLRSGRTGQLNEAQGRFAAMAARNVERLNLIISDILDVSKIEAGKMSMRFSLVDPKQLLEDVFAIFEPQATGNSLALELDCAESTQQAWADADRTEQVLANLVSNAVKFTPPGGRIVLGARPLEDGVEFSVTDSGIGIAPQAQKLVFEPFHQSGDTLTGKTRGTGLGLSISRDLVTIQGGTLQVESEVGKGSRFFFRLPLYSVQTVEMAVLETEIQAHRIYPFFGVLVVELAGNTPTELTNDPARCEQALLRIRDVLQGALSKSNDMITAQPFLQRLIVVLFGTPREGCQVVMRRLERVLDKTELELDGVRIPAPRILGPACFPQDGRSGRELVAGLHLSGAQDGGSDSRKSSPDAGLVQAAKEGAECQPGSW